MNDFVKGQLEELESLEKYFKKRINKIIKDEVDKK